MPGSPSNSTLMSPRNRIPSGRTFFEPPNSRQAIAFLISDVKLVKTAAKILETYQDFQKYSEPHFWQSAHRNHHFEPSAQILPLVGVQIVHEICTASTGWAHQLKVDQAKIRLSKSSSAFRLLNVRSIQLTKQYE